jgi:diguanylate cyclase (GGDEF)-like protein/PAS domain S-box-containing protein
LSSDNLLRLVIISSDVNDAEMMISTIKSAGYAVRAKHAGDQDSLAEALQEISLDIVLHTVGTHTLELEQTVQCLRQAGKHAPIVAITGDGSADVVDCMQQGAVDLVDSNNREHLKLVIARTADIQRQWRGLKKFEAALRESEKRCRILLDSSRDAICYVHEGMHVYANDSYLSLFGYEALEDIEGLTLMDLVAATDQKKIKSFLRDLQKAAADNESLDITLSHAEGNTFAAQMEFSSATIDGEPCTQIVIRDQSSNKELEDQLSYLSERDVATGLYNRNFFMGQLESAIRWATQEGQNSALIELEIANISEIKDRIGVAATDVVVADVAKLVESTWSEDGAVLARFGETSYTLLSSVWEPAKLRPELTRLLSELNGHICDVETKSVTTYACIGAVQLDENAPDANELLLRLEKAVAQARSKDSDQIVIYLPREGELNQKQLDRLWKDKLTLALEKNRLRLVYQPIVSLHGDPGERYDVYLRLLDENGDIVPAGKFIPSAERTGMSELLDRWLIKTAIDRLAEARQSGQDIIFFLKLTAGSLQTPELIAWLADLLRESRVSPASLVFEIKEDVIVTHLKQTKCLVKSLQDLHCRFAIDDFGTGLNPFQLLKAVSADFLKIDRSLMENIGEDRDNQETVRTLTDTAHSMGKVTVGQFVEDATSLSVLWGMGMNYVQGNFLQEPSEERNYDFSSMN